MWSIIRDFTKEFIFWETFSSDVSYIAVWFTHQNSKLLEKENKETLTLIIDLHKGKWNIQLTLDIGYMLKVVEFYLLLKIWLNIFKILSGKV